MKKLVLGFVLLCSVSFNASAYDIREDIVGLTVMIRDTIYRQPVTMDQLVELKNDLITALSKLNGGFQSSNLICMKTSNGLFYPSTNSGTLVGSNSYQAGYSDLQECRNSLPKLGQLVACFKQSNGLFYTAKPNSGDIIGSNSYQAGYSDLASCSAVLPKPWQKLACYKQSNGLFYPSDALTAQIVGSNSYQAGYSDLKSCQVSINQ